jgi:hypothetical protein
MLTVLGGLAEFERELHMGRPHSLTSFQRQEALARRDAGDTLMDSRAATA